MKMNNLIGKDMEELEREKGFDWYVEFKSRKMFGVDLEEHRRLMNVFIEFLPKEKIKVLKLNEENVEEVFELEYEEVLENIELLGLGKGKLYDEELEVSYSILTDDFLVIIQEDMIFWSSKKKLAFEWRDKLKENGLNFFEPSFIGKDEGDGLWGNKTKINGVWVKDDFEGSLG